MKLSLPKPTERVHTPRHPPGAVTLWLTTALLALLFVILFAIFDALLADISRLQASVVAAQACRVVTVPVEDLDALRASAESITRIEEQLQAALLGSQHGVPWLAIIQRIMPVPPSEVELTSITQKGDILSIRGRVPGASALKSYIAKLRGSSFFQDVQLESAADDFAVSVRLRGYER